MTEANGAGNGDQGGDQGATSGSWTAPASQEEFDRIIADRVARTKNQFKDYNDLKRKAGEYDQLEESRKSDLQRAQDREKEANDRATAAVGRAVRAEVKAIATGEFADPNDAHLYLGDLSRFVDDKGDIDSAGIEAALRDVEKAKPHLRSVARTDVGIGPRGGSPASDMNTLIRAGRGR